MTTQDAVALIVNRWRLEHTVEAIMMALIMQRMSVTRSQILAVVKRYCDATSENATYRAKGELND